MIAMIKRMPKFLATLMLSVIVFSFFASSVFAYSDDEGIEAIAITVIVPPLPERPYPTPVPHTRRVFPINVAEGYNYEGIRELVRIYELLPGESPEWINTDSFTRNGYYYQIAEIIRSVDVAHTVREHTEVVKIPSATNNLAAVIAGIDPTVEFIDEDGYVGILHLDIRSIEMTQDGTRSTSRTVSQEREFPHLSNPDMALIPLTVTVSGRTYTLADVDWRTNTTNSIDFNSVAQTFTAFATYTRTATSTVSTGYTTIAEYSGVLTRVASGDVRFVATFIGTPIVSPIVNSATAPNAEQETMSCMVVSAGKGQAYDKIEMPIGDITKNGSNHEDEFTLVTNGDIKTEANELVEDVRGISNIIFFVGLVLIFLAFIVFLVAMVFRFKGMADCLKNEQSERKKKALSYRMASIIENDREEFDELDEISINMDKYEDFDVSSIEIEEFPDDEEGDKR